MEVPLRANLVLQETPVGLLYPLGQIAEKHECRNYRILEHRDIFYLYEFTLVGGGRGDGDFLKHIRIELRSRYDSSAIGVDLYGRLEDLEYTLFCQGGSKDNREIDERGELSAYGLLITLLGRQGTVFDQIPLVDADYETLPVFLNQGEYVAVLSLYTAGRVDHEDADIRGLD